MSKNYHFIWNLKKPHVSIVIWNIQYKQKRDDLSNCIAQKVILNMANGSIMKYSDFSWKCQCKSRQGVILKIAWYLTKIRGKIMFICPEYILPRYFVKKKFKSLKYRGPNSNPLVDEISALGLNPTGMVLFSSSFQYYQKSNQSNIFPPWVKWAKKRKN